ncbi:MAG: TetR/AcrR family transcriptional regulator [Candidatus Aminicenantes bacterium]|nr:TetR/AcrR family transcriptional regulator [Candidatus Aminicenantes bacterium]
MVRIDLNKGSRSQRQARENRRRQALRQAIVQAAERVMIRHGYAALTMDDVAREAEISKATVYNYFRSKGELVLELFIYYFEKFYRSLVRIKAETKPAKEKLRDIIAIFLRFSRETETISRALIMDKAFLKKMKILVGEAGESSDREKNLIAEIKKQREKIIKEGSNIITEGITRGEFRPIDPIVTVRLIESLLQGFVHTRFWNPTRLPLEKETEILLDFIFWGLGQKNESEEMKGAGA